jgi:hypothetical protein
MEFKKNRIGVEGIPAHDMWAEGKKPKRDREVTAETSFDA